jgi:hypothetical protein
LENVGKRFVYEGNISNLSMFKMENEERPELDIAWEKLDNMAKKINLEKLHHSENSKEYDNITVLEWLNNNVKHESTKNLST